MPQYITEPELIQVEPYELSVGDWIRCEDTNGFHIGRITASDERENTLDSDGFPMCFVTVEWVGVSEHGFYVDETRKHLVSDLAGYDGVEGLLVDAWRDVTAKAVA